MNFFQRPSEAVVHRSFIVSSVSVPARLAIDDDKMYNSTIHLSNKAMTSGG